MTLTAFQPEWAAEFETFIVRILINDVLILGFDRVHVYGRRRESIKGMRFFNENPRSQKIDFSKFVLHIDETQSISSHSKMEEFNMIYLAIVAPKLTNF